MWSNKVVKQVVKHEVVKQAVVKQVVVKKAVVKHTPALSKARWSMEMVTLPHA